MFRPSSRPFAEIAGHLYAPDSFQPPPPAVAAPSRPDTWVYYKVNEGSTLPFNQFMATPAFEQAKQQIQDRIAACRKFTHENFPQAEVSKMNGNFDTFLQHLESNNAFFSEQQLQLLYSLGKRSLDEFCLLLDHPDIDVHQRKCALREMADQMQYCRGAGPAFMAALTAVQRPEGTLHGHYWSVLKDLFDQSVQRFVSTTNAGDTEVWRAGMEVHVVNRFRLELGLPGAEPHDQFSYGSLVRPDQVSQCAQWLLSECRPVNVALVLAASYRSRIQELAMKELGVGAADIDPNVDVHMDALLRAARSLAPTFEGTSIHSLLDQDLETDAFHWRQDDTLVACDLLNELARQRLIQLPEESVVLRGTSREGTWALQHVDHRLLYVQEYLPASGPGEVNGVKPGSRFTHMPANMYFGGVGQPLRRKITDALLGGDSTTVLRHMPAHWVEDETQALTLLKLQGPSASLKWAKGKQFDDQTLRHLLVAASLAGYPDLLKHLLDINASRPLPEMLELGGPDILLKAARGGNVRLLQIWMTLIRDALPTLPQDQLNALLTRAGQNHVLRDIAALGRPELIAATLRLLFELVKAKRLSPEELIQQMTWSMQYLMHRGNSALLSILGIFLSQAARHQWVSPAQLQVLLEGPTPSMGCYGAVRNNRVEMVERFNELVIYLAEHQRLSTDQAAAMLCGPGDENTFSSGAAALIVNHAEGFTAFLKGVQDAAKRGWVSPSQLMHVLSCPSPSGTHALHVLLMEATQALLTPWYECLIKLHEWKQLTSEQIVQLLKTPVFPFHSDEDIRAWTFATSLGHVHLEISNGTRLPTDTKHANWNTLLEWLTAAGVLNSEQSLELLAGGHQGRPALLRAVHPTFRIQGVGALSASFLQAHGRGVIDDQQLNQLLLGAATDGSGQNAYSVVSSEDVKQMLGALIRHVQLSQLPEGVFRTHLATVAHQRFPDGKADPEARALFVAEIESWLAGPLQPP